MTKVGNLYVVVEKRCLLMKCVKLTFGLENADFQLLILYIYV